MDHFSFHSGVNGYMQKAAKVTSELSKGSKRDSEDKNTHIANLWTQVTARLERASFHLQ